MNTITVNGITYKAVAFDFNLVCDLEDKGIALSDIQTKPLSFIRTYVALCAGKDKAFAGQEIEEHIANGGKLDDILNVLSDEMEKSDFFRNLNKTEEKKTTTSKKAQSKTE